MKTKLELHKELNAVYSTLIEISLLLGLKNMQYELKKQRTFLLKKVNNSDLPSV